MIEYFLIGWYSDQETDRHGYITYNCRRGVLAKIVNDNFVFQEPEFNALTYNTFDEALTVVKRIRYRDANAALQRGWYQVECRHESD